MTVDSRTLEELAAIAWKARRNARVITGVEVGAALVTSSGKTFSGCNVEHQYRCHDIHAEVNAISSMVAAGEQSIRAIVVAAETTCFTPCGGCLDWIFEFSGGSCDVAFQARPRAPLSTFRATHLMPHYPVLGND